MSRNIPKRVIDSAKSNDLSVTLRVGKDGLTEAVVMELKDQLKSRELVKLKINKGIISDRRGRESLISELESSTGSVSVFARGNIAVFWRV